MQYTEREIEYILWAMDKGAMDGEIAHDLGRSLKSIQAKILKLKGKHDLPERRHNAGRKSRYKHEGI